MATHFDPEDLGFIAQTALAEAERNWFYRDALLEIAVEFEQMALGVFPVTAARIYAFAVDYVCVRMDVIDDIILLLEDAGVA